jgi:hypothetical protein
MASESADDDTMTITQAMPDAAAQNAQRSPRSLLDISSLHRQSSCSDETAMTETLPEVAVLNALYNHGMLDTSTTQFNSKGTVAHACVCCIVSNADKKTFR